MLKTQIVSGTGVVGLGVLKDVEVGPRREPIMLQLQSLDPDKRVPMLMEMSTPSLAIPRLQRETKSQDPSFYSKLIFFYEFIVEWLRRRITPCQIIQETQIH